MSKSIKYLALVILSLAALPLSAWIYAQRESETQSIGRPAKIRPDYCDVVIPPNIAPLNFFIEESGVKYEVSISSTTGDPIEIHSRKPSIEIPLRRWKKLLAANRGEKLQVDIRVKDEQGYWTQFDTIENTIAEEAIDSYLAYRQISLCLIWRDMGLYQRNLENYDESVVLHNRSFGYGCINCHTFLNNDPNHMVLQTRSSEYGTPMLLAENGKVSPKHPKSAQTSGKVNFAAWHPSGKLIAITDNKYTMMLHTTAPEVRDVFDQACDLDLYRLDTEEVISNSQISRPDRMENFPEWSRDGRYLYFCSAPQLPPERYREVRCDLMRIGYDLESGAWGELETVLTADDAGGSINQPRFSPDGRFLLFNVVEYSDFPVDKVNCDLHMLDIETGAHRRLSISSERNDSWHSWSSNSRWIAFSSRRIDGRFSRPFFSYVDAIGEAHKPFVLPQKDPEYYDTLLWVLQVPELIKSPIPVKEKQFTSAIVSYKKQFFGADSPWKSGSSEPASRSGVQYQQ
ncbi:PD40 domain-containing protein [Candidatus Sumerlaeota bacterium]|nr:PD40 domain-containing protein [Candidatus Sumerlaeota bacterium]